jgi:plastocyanin
MTAWQKQGILGCAIVATALAWGAAASPDHDREGRKPIAHTVHVEGMRFKPQVLEIAPGDSVTWINDDIFIHAVKSIEPNDAWQSKDIPAHAQWTRRFDRGVHYLCPYHPTMTGQIVVKTSETAKP